MNNIVGKKYPMRDEHGIIVAYGEVTSYIMASNIAAVIIGLNGRPADIVIPIATAVEIINEKVNQ